MKRPVATWLYACACAVFLMALIGAVTRLTESGLSIVEWKPVAGALPPLDAAAWQKEFALYKQTPQYLKINRGMTLPEFKHIFFWEWLHRLWGRMIGAIFAVPFLWFLLRGKIPAEKRAALLGVLALGGLQGLAGWLMVKSGLVDRPSVSHYRLALHLMLAALIYAWLLRLGLSLGLRPQPDAGRLTRLRRGVRGTLALAAVTMTWGAFTAGLRAGWLYNTFPAMDGHWLPPELWSHTPLWAAFFEEPATVQFTHRVLALLTLLKIVLLCRRAFPLNPTGRLRRLFRALLAMGFAQVALGISTLLSGVNLYLAAAHQGGAFIVLGLLVWLLHEIPHIPKTPPVNKKEE